MNTFKNTSLTKSEYKSLRNPSSIKVYIFSLNTDFQKYYVARTAYSQT